MTTQNPIEVARETLKQLTVRKLLPTPENFERVYHELTQTPVDRDNKLAVLLLRALETLPQDSVQAKVTLTRLKQVFDENRWEQAPQLIIDFLRSTLNTNQQQHSWGTLIQNLIRNWDLRLPNMPQHHKQSTLERVLINYGNQPDELNQKLATLIQNWTQSAPPGAPANTAAEAAAPTASGDNEENLGDSWLAWQRTLASPSSTAWSRD